jgi:hypothetical protein
MEIALTVEQEAQLHQIAALEGKVAEEMAREVLSRGLKTREASLTASPSRGSEGTEAAARLLELRKGNLLPEGVTIEDLIREGRA